MNHNLSGKYRLVSHGSYSEDRVFTPTSSFAKGELNYGKDGSLSVLILFAEEPKTARDVFSYVGSYQTASDKVVEHHVTLSSVVKMNNIVEERTYSFDGKELRLSKVSPDGWNFEAVWIKES